MSSNRGLFVWVGIALLACGGAVAGEVSSASGPARVLVGQESDLLYWINHLDPGFGQEWIGADFDEDRWIEGRFGVGYETARITGARGLLYSKTNARVLSIYCRARFTIDDPSAIDNLYLGADFDDGFVAWINGVEVTRSETMPDGPPQWNTRPDSHESSNGSLPRFHPRHDISAVGIPALRAGENLLAIGVWNSDPRGTDLVLAAELLANQPLGTFVTRGPYLQLGTPTGVTVLWRTDRPTDSRVSYGPAPGALRQSVVDPEVTTEHRLRIENLPPDGTVHYAVGTSTTVLAGGDGEHRFHTAAPPGTRRPFRVWVLGDTGTGGAIPGWVRDGYTAYVGDEPTDLWILLGDNAYKDGSDHRYQAALFRTFRRMLRRAVVWSTPGNHDHIRSRVPLDGTYYDVFEFPTEGEAGGIASGTEAYYSFDYGNVHFVSINSEHLEFTRKSPMLPWLERDLAATEADWILAFWHRAPYSTGLHDSDVSRKTTFMRRHVLPILDRHGVDLVMAGHSHICQRTGMLRSHYGTKDSFAPSMVVDGTSGRPEEGGPYRKSTERQSGDGIVYATVGCSAESTVTDPAPPEMLISTRRPGSMVLEFDGLRLDARYIDSKGSVRDEFTLVKTPPPSGDVYQTRVSGTPMRIHGNE